MTWKLWLDDDALNVVTPERHAPGGYTYALSSAQAIKLVEENGPPFFMDLDHDLGLLQNGDCDTAMIFLKWLLNTYPDAEFEYEIHSKNPVGRANIKSYIDSYVKSKTI